ncbi:GCN5-like N-acetyltransferase [Acidiphilium sp. JA12-A1]|nr:GCN5-like N-acetyltransferase [Acidiphilium sp. JA12-A1]
MTAPMLHEALFGPQPLARAVLAEADGAVAGFALFFTSFSTWTGRAGLYLEDLFVLPAARGRGIGRALLRHLAREAVRLGCARLEWSVLDWNRPAIDFYQSLGAVPLDEWTRYRLKGEALAALAA